MNPVMERFQKAIELSEAMIAMHRQLLIREHPEESADQIDRRLHEWVTEPRPGRQRETEPRP
jgi:Rv0078B-related antitoxin